MPEDLDDDLQDLLNQLDDEEVIVPIPDEPAEEPVEDIPESEVSTEETPVAEGNGKPATRGLPATILTGDEPREGKKPVALTGDEQALRSVDELIPTDARRVDGSGDQQLISAESSSEPELDLSKYLDQMDGVTKEVLQACRSDRQEAQDVINMLRRQVDDAHSKGNSPARMYVDGLVKSVEVKSNINATAVKVMEGVGKMIAATKAGVNIQNNNLSLSGGDLDDLLTQKLPDDLD